MPRNRSSSRQSKKTEGTQQKKIPLLSRESFSVRTRLFAHLVSPFPDKERESGKNAPFSGFCVGDIEYRPHSKMGIFAYRINFLGFESSESPSNFVETIQLQVRAASPVFVADLMQAMLKERKLQHVSPSEAVLGSVHLNQIQIDHLLHGRLQLYVHTYNQQSISGRIKCYKGFAHDGKYATLFQSFGFL